MSRPDHLTMAQARRVALEAQGFTDGRLGVGGSRVDRRHVRRVFGRVDLIQIDSVNVLVRSQELPLFSRLGPHARNLLPRLAADVETFEYWCHEASILPVGHWPLVQWRMRAGESHWASRAHDGAFVEAVYAEVAERGPIAVGDLSQGGPRGEGMWGWSDGKRALEALFYAGRITARRRPRDFARVYQVVEDVIPAAVRAAPVPSRDDAERELLDRAARAVGVGTDRCIADYHRLNLPRARPLIRDLVDAGRLIPVLVEGWGRPTYLHVEARLPRRVRARALLSPFDSLVWERRRTEELFGFRYRLEIYVPKPKRVHGYYVLPFLLGDRIVARVDLKADRATGRLLVRGAFGESGHDPGEVAEALASELEMMAAWLTLPAGPAVEGRGDLAPVLEDAVARL